ncbi:MULTISPECIES: TlyA family RNA methyltransferase [unclassified Chelatococcus]|uniref:TlyA family RNA methyltransferase n=1 Tax=unclassified Chelatococcus TaxID=2638111 RepID=UPI00031F2869|nr:MULTISPECIES: TlyA family RNA methyltransferase [unclassified Chelatococcus]ALA18221.1 hemolysin [Chelatococcus sp. CO-6]
MRKRADLLLVERGFFDSRAKAQAAIAAGGVTADGRPVRKASDALPVDAAIAAEAPHPWVSRAGVKLAAALDAFAIDPAGLVCLDIGASTGGFTEVLVARGAAKVYAVDVGHGQLHPRLAADPRVVSLEGVDARALTAAEVPEAAGLMVADVSFISLKLVLPAVTGRLADGGHLVALVKPQFEAGRAHLKKGIVREEAVRQAVVEDIATLVRDLGLTVLGTMPSPIAGGDGNVEYLIGARRG